MSAPGSLLAQDLPAHGGCPAVPCSPSVAALFIDSVGCYVGVPEIDAWPENTLHELDVDQIIARCARPGGMSDLCNELRMIANERNKLAATCYALRNALQNLLHYRAHTGKCKIGPTDFCTCGMKNAADHARRAIEQYEHNATGDARRDNASPKQLTIPPSHPPPCSTS